MTEKRRGTLGSWLLTLALLCLASMLLSIFILVPEKEKATEKAYALGLEAGSREAARQAGYPASITELEDNATYWVNALSSEIEADHTNYFAELRQVMRGADAYIRDTTTNRLITLPWNVAAALGTNRYYRAFVVPFEDKTNVSFMEVPPPSRAP